MKNDNKRPFPWRLVVSASAIAAICGGAAFADYVVGSGEPVVISDDVFDRTTQVVSLAGPTGGDTSPTSSPSGGDSTPASPPAGGGGSAPAGSPSGDDGSG